MKNYFVILNSSDNSNIIFNSYLNTENIDDTNLSNYFVKSNKFFNPHNIINTSITLNDNGFFYSEVDDIRFGRVLSSEEIMVLNERTKEETDRFSSWLFSSYDLFYLFSIERTNSDIVSSEFLTSYCIESMEDLNGRIIKSINFPLFKEKPYLSLVKLDVDNKIVKSIEKKNLEYFMKNHRLLSMCDDYFMKESAKW